jgi:hypothetical protein
MNIILDIEITNAESNKVYCRLHKVHDRGWFPVPGIHIEDSAFAEARMPNRYTINFEENHCHLHLDGEVGRDEKHCKEIEELYEAHGWKRPEKMHDTL